MQILHNALRRRSRRLPSRSGTNAPSVIPNPSDLYVACRRIRGMSFPAACPLGVPLSKFYASALSAFLASCLLMISASTFAASYFVTQDGAGDMTGRNITNACKGLMDPDCQPRESGSKVYVCGDFRQTLTWIISSQISAVWDGNCSGYGFAGTATVQNASGAYNLQWRGSGTATVKNIAFLGGGTSDCVNILGSGSLMFTDVAIENCRGDGLDVDDTNVTSLVLQRSVIRNVARYGVFCGNIGHPSGVVIKLNKFIDNGYSEEGDNFDAIAIGDGCAPALVEENDISGQGSFLGAGIDIQDSTGSPTAWSTVRRNYIRDCRFGPGLTSTGSTSTLFYANSVSKCHNGALIKGASSGAKQQYFNNVFADSFSSGIKIGTSATGPAAGVDLKNNTVINSNGVSIEVSVLGCDVNSDYNTFYGGAGFQDAESWTSCSGICPLADWQRDGRDTHSRDVQSLIQ
jgi:hypothetical protein